MIKSLEREFQHAGQSRGAHFPIRTTMLIRPCFAWSADVFGITGSEFFDMETGKFVRMSVSSVVSSSGFDMRNPSHFVEAREHPGITMIFLTTNRTRHER